MSPPSRRPIRVCHLAYTFHESDNRVMRYVQALAERGDSVDVVVLRRPGAPWTEKRGSVTYYQIQRRITTERAAWSYLVKLAWFCLKSAVLISYLQVKRRYDFVHVHNVPDFLVFAGWLPRLMGGRVILDIHDIVPELYAGKFNGQHQSPTFRLLAAIERLSCSFAHHVITSNALWHDKLTKRSVEATRCSSFINFPDLSVFKPKVGRLTNASGFVFLYPGSLNHHQGVDIAVRAFGRARHQMPGAVFHIYGRGPALPALKELVKDQGLGDVVKFMDFLPTVSMAEVMASASAGLVPKRADGFGNEAFSTKILEFMACEVPVIVSRTRIDEYYFDDSVVTFFTSGSDESLASAMREVFRDRQGAAAKARAARNLADTLSWQANRAQYYDLLHTLTPASSGRP
jgi:glycosyltransferase involved in cell wall biosynthesis